MVTAALSRNVYQIYILLSTLVQPHQCLQHALFPHCRQGRSAKKGMTLRVESGDDCVTSSNWDSTLLVAAGYDPFQLADLAVAAAARLSGTSNCLTSGAHKILSNLVYLKIICVVLLSVTSWYCISYNALHYSLPIFT